MSFLSGLEPIFIVTGLVLVAYSFFSLRDRPLKNGIPQACFWFLLGTVMAAGPYIPHWLCGLIVLVLVALDGARLLGTGSYGEKSDKVRIQRAGQLRERVFIPVLLVPLVVVAALIAARVLKINTSTTALVWLGYGTMAACLAAMIISRSRPARLLQQGRRISEIIGAVLLLPPLLASLGLLFREAGVGDIVARFLSMVVPQNSLFAGCAVYCLGMAVFTFIMGNGFAAFAVITAGIGVPFVLQGRDIDPNMITALALTAGYCGTLMTPMAANFNIVPVALLEMKNRTGVIRFQVPFALVLLGFHIMLMWLLAGGI